MKRYSVIFDLDGTLWDVFDVAKYSADVITNKYGLKPVSRDAVSKSFGQTREGSAKNYFPDLPLCDSLPLIDEIITDTADNVISRGGRLYNGVAETLNELSLEYDLFIVSNSPQQKYVMSFIDFSGTESLFKQCYSVGLLGLTKGQGIKKIVNDNAYLKAVYVGDTVMDYDSANEAGIPFIFAKYGFGNAPNARYKINNFFELPGVIEKVFSGE